MAHPKPTPKRQPFVVHSHALTQEEGRLLRQLSQEASDALGWAVSSSAVVRALLRHVARQPPAWPSATLLPIIEEEIAAGVVWGSKKK
jgi:hypothetical protein